jgi:threonine/homoserine/homoserine lactone efflux protein
LGALILPGPDFAVTLGYSLIHGRKNAITCAFGIAIGVMLNALISFWIGQSLHSYFLVLYKIFVMIGLIYLTYSGIILIKHYFQLNYQSGFLKNNDAINAKKPLITGILTNISNVKAIVFFNATLPLVHRLNTPFKIITWIGVGILTMAWFSLVAYLFGHTRIRDIFLNKIKIVEIIMGSVLILFSFTIFCSEIL